MLTPRIARQAATKPQSQAVWMRDWGNGQGVALVSVDLGGAS